MEQPILDCSSSTLAGRSGPLRRGQLSCHCYRGIIRVVSRLLDRRTGLLCFLVSIHHYGDARRVDYGYKSWRTLDNVAVHPALHHISACGCLCLDATIEEDVRVKK